MAALEQDRYIWRRDGQILSIPVKSGVHIFKGALVCTATGLATPATDLGGVHFAGVATESADNTDGDDGDVQVRVWQSGVFPCSNRLLRTRMLGPKWAPWMTRPSMISR